MLLFLLYFYYVDAIEWAGMGRGFVGFNPINEHRLNTLLMILLVP
jgi:hypothetical protein